MLVVALVYQDAREHFRGVLGHVGEALPACVQGSPMRPIADRLVLPVGLAPDPYPPATRQRQDHCSLLVHRGPPFRVRWAARATRTSHYYITTYGGDCQGSARGLF